MYFVVQGHHWNHSVGHNFGQAQRLPRERLQTAKSNPCSAGWTMGALLRFTRNPSCPDIHSGAAHPQWGRNKKNKDTYEQAMDREVMICLYIKKFSPYLVIIKRYSMNNISEKRAFFLLVKPKLHHGPVCSHWHTFSLHWKCTGGVSSWTGQKAWGHLLVERNLPFQHVRYFIHTSSLRTNYCILQSSATTLTIWCLCYWLQQLNEQSS